MTGSIPAIAHSGSSYISGYDICSVTRNIVINDNASMESGVNDWNWSLYIEIVYLCPEKFSFCTDENTCVKVFDDIYLFDSKCHSNCTFLNSDDKFYCKNLIEQTCDECQIENCVDCSSDHSKCIKCADLFCLDEKTNKWNLCPTNYFSRSKQFSSSFHFSLTDKFSYSDTFSKSPIFSETLYFSQTKKFSESNDFSKTNDFSYTKNFSQSKAFSHTNDFSYSAKFS